MQSGKQQRRFPVGAEMLTTGVSFRVWAPSRTSVSVVIGEDDGVAVPLSHEADGYFQGVSALARPGSLYRFRLDGDVTLYPDPASRFQPAGPHGPSQVVDAAAFGWTDSAWSGLTSHGQVLYEMHVGTFTPEGTWRAAAEHLADLAEIGITAVEVLPVAEFAGDFGWGYDGVQLFAPFHRYGSPDDFRRFIDRAHALGLGVILDVVYNHFGPDGDYTAAFSPFYISDRYRNEWGDALNFDGEHCGPVREFMCANAAYWIESFHLDGLRLDATQAIQDASRTHILTEIVSAARSAARGRSLFIVAENEPQRIEHVLPREEGGYGIDALWNDDFHHSAVVALIGRPEAYYTDYRGTPQEFISAAKHGYLYQGQWYSWQKKRRGTAALRVPPRRFVTCLENHDQIANTGRGQRLHELCSPASYRAMTALWLLSPGTPMLLQGQEFASSRPFVYFADHQPDLARKVLQGRRDFLSQFPSLASEAMQALVRDPDDPASFEDSKLDWSERRSNSAAVELHRDLIALRRGDAMLSQCEIEFDGAVLSEHALVLRYFGEDGGDRLLLVNLGDDLDLRPAPEPLLAEPQDHDWQLVLSTDDPRYGGLGISPVDWNSIPHLPGRCALFFTSHRRPK